MAVTDDLLLKLSSQGAPQSQLSRLSDLVALAERDATLLAICLVGSYAKGLGDRVSDLDLVAVTARGCGAPVLAAAHELLGRSEVLKAFSGTHSGGGGFWKLVYLDFTSVEFHVFESDTPFKLRRPYLSVWDPAGLLSSYLVDGEPVAHANFSAYEHGDEGLIWELVDCIKWLSRGRTELARNHLKKLAAEMDKRDAH